MDASTIQAAYTGLKAAIATLRAVAGTKAQIAADFRVVDVLEQLGHVQDTMFELRNELAGLQEENVRLKGALREQRYGKRVLQRTAVMTAGWVALVGATSFILIFQGLRWLKLGEWPDWSPMALGFMPPVTHLLGINKIFAWLYDLQLWELSLIAGGALFGLGIWIAETRRVIQ